MDKRKDEKKHEREDKRKDDLTKGRKEKKKAQKDENER